MGIYVSLNNLFFSRPTEDVDPGTCVMKSHLP